MAISAKRKARPADEVGAQPEELVGYYRDMLLIRRFEEKEIGRAHV